MKSLAVKIWIMILALAVAGYAAYEIRAKTIERQQSREQDHQAKMELAEKGKLAITSITPKPVALDSFTMIERSGKKMSLDELRGQVWIGSMFYASCAKECLQLNQTIAALQKDPLFKDVKFVSITVDPAVDTPEALAKAADGLGADPKHWLFLSGDLDDVARFGKQTNVAAGYKVHVSRLILFDRQGRVRGYFTFDDAAQIARLREEVPKLLTEKSDSPAGGGGQGHHVSGSES